MVSLEIEAVISEDKIPGLSIDLNTKEVIALSGDNFLGGFDFLQDEKIKATTIKNEQRINRLSRRLGFIRFLMLQGVKLYEMNHFRSKAKFYFAK